MNELIELDIDVLDTIPQRAPLVMVDRLLSADGKKIVSALHISPTCILTKDSFLTESGIIENIAQTGAAGFGYMDKKEGKPVSLGFIASIKDIKIFRLPPVDSGITTVINVLKPVFDFQIIEGSISQNEEVIASCEMRIYIKR